MNRTERFYRIDQLLHERRVVPLRVFLETLQVSRATFKRDLEYMRERLHAPIVWDREARGYRFGPAGDGPVYALPGLWFSPSELYALLAAQRLLAELEPGILTARIAPLQARLSALLEIGGHPAQEVVRRVRIASVARRPIAPQCFTEVALAVMKRRRLEIDAWNRERDEINTRVVSPQRLVHYRDNWYLDAWCHWRQALRSFALDAVRAARPLPQRAREVPQARLQGHYESSYGIFAGKPKGRAVLRFSPERARWVRSEVWHPDQQGRDLPGGGWELTVPYADARELLMDILRHGHHVEVVAPASLRAAVAQEVRRMARCYAAERVNRGDEADGPSGA